MGRSQEFVNGIPVDPFVSQRYGDQKQLPAASPRRAGPLPYPQTYEDHIRDEHESDWSKSE